MKMRKAPELNQQGPSWIIKIILNYLAIVFTSFFGSTTADLSSTDFGSLLDDWFANEQSLFLSSPTEDANVFKETRVKDKRISAFIKILPLWFTQYVAENVPIVTLQLSRSWKK
jgi:hypothetical protein